MKLFTLIPGLLLVVAGVAGAATGTVTFDFTRATGFGTPFLFGGCHYPLKAQEADVYPKLTNSGIVYVKSDLYFEKIIPASKCASVEDYKSNVNGIQNPNTWDYSHLYWIDDSRKYGLKTFVLTTYTPTWLSCSGTFKGVPKDWDVWEDLVRKVYARYKTRVDWVEIWNEIEYWNDLTGSPYTDREDFLVDRFYHTVKAIREAGGTIPTGGFAFAWDEPEMFQHILTKLVAHYGQAWTDRNFNFYSVHHYGSEAGTIDTGPIRAAFDQAGLNPYRPIFVDEWNYTSTETRQDDELHGARAIGYVGKTLANFVKSGVDTAYYSMAPSDSPMEDGSKTTLAFYTAQGSTGTLLPQSYPFKILSNRLGLGRGNFTVRGVYDQTVIDACAAVNSAGQKVAFIANYYDSLNTVNVAIKGLKGNHVAITEYWADTWDPTCGAYKTITNSVTAGHASHIINMQPNTCAGLVFEAVP